MDMDKLVSLCKRRGFLFQSSEIYGGSTASGLRPARRELKRNVKEAWWRDMVVGHDELSTLPGAPKPYQMVGLDCSIIMHPQVWKVSGHLRPVPRLHGRLSRVEKRYRHDQVNGRWATGQGQTPFRGRGQRRRGGREGRRTEGAQGLQPPRQERRRDPVGRAVGLSLNGAGLRGGGGPRRQGGRHPSRRRASST